METVGVNTLLNLFSNLGIAGIFLYLFMNERKSNEKKSDELLDAYKENTRIQQQVANNIEKNTTITDKVYEILLKRDDVK